MIVKDKEGPIPTDKMGRAGYDAEKQMAFYLRRAFAEASDIFVFNDIRFVRNGEAAQIPSWPRTFSRKQHLQLPLFVRLQ